MSYSQPSSLPPGYSLRVAIENDWIKLWFFHTFAHQSLIFKMCILSILLILIIVMPLVACTAVFFMYAFPFFVSALVLLIDGHVNGVEEKEIFDFIVEFNGDICASITLIKFNDYITFVPLVGEQHRRRLIGSSLVSFITENFENPIYTICHTNLKSFYIRSGFVDADLSNIPTRLEKWNTYFNLNRRFCLMLFNEVNS